MLCFANNEAREGAQHDWPTQKSCTASWLAPVRATEKGGGGVGRPRIAPCKVEGYGREDERKVLEDVAKSEDIDLLMQVRIPYKWGKVRRKAVFF